MQVHCNLCILILLSIIRLHIFTFSASRMHWGCSQVNLFWKHWVFSVTTIEIALWLDCPHEQMLPLLPWDKRIQELKLFGLVFDLVKKKWMVKCKHAYSLDKVIKNRFCVFISNECITLHPIVATQHCFVF